MTEKTEEQIARERAAVDAMRNAKANMDAALARIASLEEGLKTARHDLTRVKDYVGRSAYVYGGQQTAHDSIDDMIARATKALGA